MIAATRTIHTHSGWFDSRDEPEALPDTLRTGSAQIGQLSMYGPIGV
jgi:hypothetical protein